ncbi:MAG: single-stranded-DNA-specific exonuclease RecJ [Pelovirga sp.]
MRPVRQRQWQLRAAQPPPQVVGELAATLRVSRMLAQVLCLRDYATPDRATRFLQDNLAALPDPFLLPQMTAACARLHHALINAERIAVHGDYDVDGISGCALLVESLRSLGAVVDYHIPLRLKDGYGLSAAAIHQAAADGCSLIISVDCGVSAHAEAQLASGLGLDLIITDHHQPPDELPGCVALINPHLPTSRFPFADLAGVGVAFFLLIGLRRYLREQGYFAQREEPDLRQSLDLVALGTIADIVPLTDVNRILVRAGLRLLESGRRPGIAALKRVAGVKQMNSGVVGFRLAPRLNAAGRLEDAVLGVRLLLGDVGEDVDDLAQRLDRFNRERQTLEISTLNEAIALLDEPQRPQRYSIVLASADWHAGVIGIVASRLVERYYRPTVLIALDGDGGKGSARSVKDFHLFKALTDCADLLEGFGGHAMAAGMSLRGEQLAAFVDRFEAVAATRLTDEQLCPQLLHDGEMPLSCWQPATVEELDRIGPCGAGNPQPAFVSRRCRIHGSRIVRERHLRFEAVQGEKRCAAIAFGQAERISELTGEVDLLYRPGLNHWQGRTSVQLQIVDFRPAGLP